MQQGVEPELSFELRRYWSVLKRQKWLVIGTTLMVFLVAVGLTALRRQDAPTSTPVPGATSTGDSVALLIHSASPQAPLSDVSDMPTHARLVGSLETASAVSEGLDLEAEPEDLLRHLTVAQDPGTRILVVTYTGVSGEEPQAVASTFANTYLRTLTTQRERSLTRQIDALEAQSASIQRRASEAEGEIARALLVDKLAELDRAIVGFRADLQTLDAGEILSGAPFPAATPSTPASSTPSQVTTLSTKRNGAAGLFLGLLLGAALAFAREAFDGRLRTVRRAKEKLGVPILLWDAGEIDGESSSAERAFHLVERFVGSDTELLMTGLADTASIGRIAQALSQAGARKGRHVKVSEGIPNAEGAALNIIVCPPYFEASDAAERAAHGAPMLLVLDGASSEAEAIRMLDELRELGAERLAVALLNADEY